MITAQRCIAQVRNYLNDPMPTPRWSNDTLLMFLNQSLGDIFVMRPDLMVDETGETVTDAKFETVNEGTVFLHEKYEAAIALGCAARALELDNNDTNNIAIAASWRAMARAETAK